MKLSKALALTVGAGVVAFLVGRVTQTSSISEAAAPSGLQTKSSAREVFSKATRETADSSIRAMGKYASCSQEFSAENAVKLSSEERLELLAKGASVGHFGNQAAMLCGLISVLTRDELSEATDILERMQALGNSQAPNVWKSLWNQWGRLAPEECLNFFKKNPSDKSPTDARNVMNGWLEADGDAAFTWAQMPGKSFMEAAAAALAITRNANGDMKLLEVSMLKIAGDGLTTQACLEDYFDLAGLKAEGQTAAAIYDALAVELKPIAWAVTAKRIGYGDPAAAKARVVEHAADPGCHYDGISDLFDTLYYPIRIQKGR